MYEMRMEKVFATVDRNDATIFLVGGRIYLNLPASGPLDLKRFERTVLKHFGMLDKDGQARLYLNGIDFVLDPKEFILIEENE